MVIIYRGMRADPVTPNQPLAENNNGNALGVRSQGAGADVVTYQANQQEWVDPQHNGSPQGISVAVGSGCNLPPHRRPKGAPWNGTGANGLIVWELDTTNLVPAQLAEHADPLPGQPSHYVVAPAVLMSLAMYQGYVTGTAAHWVQSPPPVPACAVPAFEGEAVEPHLTHLAVRVAGGGEPGELIDAIVAANRAGTGRAEIVAGIEAEVARAEAAGDDAGAEHLRGVLDRITGWCAPSLRVELT
jgi:hypothetical protein